MVVGSGLAGRGVGRIGKGDLAVELGLEFLVPGFWRWEAIRCPSFVEYFGSALRVSRRCWLA